MNKALMRAAEHRFESLRRTDEQDVEFWSARDLMPTLGYAKWERFADAIDRACVVARNMGIDPDLHFARVSVRSVTEGAGRPREDFHVSRYGAYLIAMNGDPRKPPIAGAMHYFAVKTRQAEIAEQDGTAPITSSHEELLLEALAERVATRLEVVLNARLDGILPGMVLPEGASAGELVDSRPKTVKELVQHGTHETVRGTELMTAREYCQAIGLPLVAYNAQSLGQHGSILAADQGIDPVYDPPSSNRPMYPANIWNAARKRQIDARLRKGVHPDTGRI